MPLQANSELIATKRIARGGAKRAAACGRSLGPPLDLIPLPARRLRSMRAAAADMFAVLDACAGSGSHPVRDVIATSPAPFAPLTNYPPKPVEDTQTGSAWFYHAHEAAEARPWHEHGHFHCFGMAKALRKGARPLALPEDPGSFERAYVHLAAISIDPNGVPTRLFATNRWVTNEWMYPARHIVPLIERFEVHTDARFALTSRWLSAMLRLFQPHIAWLLAERDRVIAARRAAGAEIFTEDESVEAVSVAGIDIDAHLGALDRAWQTKVAWRRP